MADGRDGGTVGEIELIELVDEQSVHKFKWEDNDDKECFVQSASQISSFPLPWIRSQPQHFIHSTSPHFNSVGSH